MAHLFRKRGLKRLDHYAIFMENNSRYLEACGAGERSGLYYTCANSYLTASELAYILANSRNRESSSLPGKARHRTRGYQGMPQDRNSASSPMARARASALSACRPRPPGCRTRQSPMNASGTAMLYSSGPPAARKGVLRPLAEQPPEQNLPLFDFS